jgi:thiazolylpeptide-type bacteriocin precursor
MTSIVQAELDEFSFTLSAEELQSIKMEAVDVVTVTDAMALPETGASGGSSSSTSTCGSSSCCSIL